ncbi:GNAT family N-acetyltransferase [Tropicibacter sp. R16_0]|uniref:GNAT family N-acetyltransferase n=1 Tax=Tropicibacter sp. R16_0 TaxID=2821102 RepID=UPI001ADC9604|nr:GNAT family N-acetyltransferase [Tropicibacter sp. R16_0]MBO9453393.1 GNAT family N-acetyltransferase [Tropicibacter sp. R16_0]
MQNKRGISQTFGGVPQGQRVRPATVFDVFDMSRVLIRSITELCVADHQGDPDRIAAWTANKSPEGIRQWLSGTHDLWVAELEGQVCGVGATSPEGAVSVLYVDPSAVGRGVGTALLAQAEQHLREAGHHKATLDSTATARGFYLRHGWAEDRATQDVLGKAKYPLSKLL